MFDLKYEKPTTPCILSPYQPNSDGYAHVKVKHNGRYHSVKHHRIVYAEVHKLSPLEMKNLVVMHKCDVRNCINPEHLMLGTVAMNNQDKLQKGRNVGFSTGNSCQKLGTGNTKLTEAQVREIRACTGMTQVQIAKKYGITQANVAKIRLRQSFTHVE